MMESFDGDNKKESSILLSIENHYPSTQLYLQLSMRSNQGKTNKSRKGLFTISIRKIRECLDRNERASEGNTNTNTLASPIPTTPIGR